MALRTVKRRHTSAPPPKDWVHAEAIFATIPRAYRRDRVIYRLLFTCGLRAFEALRLQVEDVLIVDRHATLTLRNHHGKPNGRTIRLTTDRLSHAVLLDELRAYMQHIGHRDGLLFRQDYGCAGGQPMTLSILDYRWRIYTRAARSSWTLKQLRAG